MPRLTAGDKGALAFWKIAKRRYNVPAQIEEAHMKAAQCQLDRRKFLSSKEVSDLLDIPEGTLRQWRCKGVGPRWHKLRGSVRYDMDHVDQFIHESERIPSVRAFTEGHLVSVSAA
jgi:hypothetical protein